MQSASVQGRTGRTPWEARTVPMAPWYVFLVEFQQLRTFVAARVRAGLDQARCEGRQLGRPKSAALKVLSIGLGPASAILSFGLANLSVCGKHPFARDRSAVTGS